MLLEHNKKLYDELESRLENDNKTLLVLGTGLGKTSTALEYLERHNIDAIVVCPTILIADSWKEYPRCKAVMTYIGFANCFKDLNYENYGAIIFDEVHHAGAEKWGIGAKYVLQHVPNIKVIGLTATPVRTDNLDIGTELFEESVCEGLSVLEGISCGVIHPFSYVGAYYDTDLIAEEYEENPDVDRLLIGKLNLAINNTPTLKSIIETNMPKGNRKGIIFTSDIESMDEAIAIIKNVYPDYEYRKIYSGMTDKEIAKNKSWFKECEKGFLCSVNMISEGAHYDNVNTLFMLRKTSSGLVFEQQLGRVITLVKKENPNAIVFDLVNNANTIKNINGFTKTLKKLRDKALAEKIKEDLIREGEKLPSVSEQIIIKDYTAEISAVLEEIEDSLDDSWEDWEIEILEKYYESEGSKGVQRRIDEEWKRRLKEN